MNPDGHSAEAPDARRRTPDFLDRTLTFMNICHRLTVHDLTVPHQRPSGNRCAPPRIGIRRGTVLRLLIAFALAATSGIAQAQYFGRNKVRYKALAFRYLQTDHYNIYFYDPEESAIKDVARMAERWYQREQSMFQHQFEGHKPLIIYANQSDFAQTNVIPGELTEATGGVTEPLRERVVLPLTGLYRDTDHVLGHEMVHVFQFDIAQNGGDTLRVKMDNLPLWFVEGMAEYMSLGRNDPQTAMWMRDAALRDDIPTISQLGRNQRFFPYRFGQALWAYIGGVWGDQAIADLYRSAGSTGLDDAFKEVLGVSSDSLSVMWKRATREYYLPLSEGRTKPDDTGEPVITSSKGAGKMNLAPSISPDGRYVAFLSDEGLFSIDLFIADATTGAKIKRLTSTATDPHLDALRFVDSAGSWSPKGDFFAFIITRQGRNEIAILSVEDRRIIRSLRVPGAGSLSTPAWSPDGKTIVVSGSVAGASDIYSVELSDGGTSRLTDDKYAQLAPTWSPDGKTIAYVTDEGPETDLSGLKYGNLRIGLLDVQTSEHRTIAPFPSANNVNPEYGPDGRDLFFISNPDGFNDIYRLHLASGEIFRVTRVRTGVTGITDVSPAMSVARGTGRVLFSVFENNEYKIYGRDSLATRGEPVEPGGVEAGILPPAHPGGILVVSKYLSDPATGLVDAARFEEKRYRPSLSLLAAGSTGIGVSFDRFGTALGGGLGLFFSDMLDNRELAVVAQVNGSYKDFGAEVSYQNNRTRWTWGTTLGHVPYLSVIDYISTDPSGNTVYTEVRDRQYNDGATLIGQYPFSSSRRAEVGLGLTRLSFNTEQEVVTVDNNGFVISDVTERNPSNFFAEPPKTLVQPYAAYVGDNAVFGYTSPVAGRRFRLEVDPTFGSLSWNSVLADYRRYVFVRPLTLAWRGVHYGRYGSDAENPILTPLYLGYATLVRGYDSGTFQLSECPRTGITCPAFDRLIGSRLFVSNVELRFPFVGGNRFGLINFPLLPIELGAFGDVGLAYSRGDDVSLKFTRDANVLRNDPRRFPVFSTGLTSRINVLGAVILEIFYVYPFQRPDKGAYFGYQLAAGW
jgi:Tol biopolymer transport system component